MLALSLTELQSKWEAFWKHSRLGPGSVDWFEGKEPFLQPWPECYWEFQDLKVANPSLRSQF